MIGAWSGAWPLQPAWIELRVVLAPFPFRSIVPTDDFLRWRAQQELRGLGQAMAEQATRAGLEEEDLAAALEADHRVVYDAHYRGQAGE